MGAARLWKAREAPNIGSFQRPSEDAGSSFEQTGEPGGLLG